MLSASGLLSFVWACDRQKKHSCATRLDHSALLLGRSQEDAQLTKVIEDLLADRSWSDIASADWRMVSAKMPGRSTKQCRERYFNVLDPSIVRTPWRAEELDVLFK